MVQDGKGLANKRSDNTLPAILKAIKGLQKQGKGLALANTLFCLAHTGIDAYPLLDTLKQEEASIWLEQAIQIQRSLGVQRGKSDRVDAQRIALDAYKIGKRSLSHLWARGWWLGIALDISWMLVLYWFSRVEPAWSLPTRALPLL